MKFLLLIVLTVSVANSAVAESLNEYCISQVSQQKVEKPRKNSEEVESSIPPFIGSIENLPQIYKNPCNILSIECVRKTFFSYSPTLDRVFIQGYRKTFLGRGFVHLEISKSGTKSVPDALIESGFAEDIPELNGVLFSGHSEALFYDGKRVTNISSYFPKLKRKDQKRNWNFRKIANGRMFFVSTDYYSRGVPFIMEIKKGLRTTLIPIPKELENTYTQFFTLPNSSRLLVVTKNALLTEFEGKLQNVLIISPPFGITDTAYVEQLVDGSIAFKIQNENTKSITNYVLKHTSSTANCEIMLNPDKPVLLQPESEINNHKQSRVNIDKIVNSLLQFFKIVD
ncbi:MAG: hypothetical protein ACRC2S_26820 [Waterburya sp.]